MRRVRIHDDFNALPAELKTTFATDKTAKSFFLTASWFNVFSRAVLGCDQMARIYSVESVQDATVRLVIPMSYLPTSKWFKPRRLEGMANFYTCLFGPLAHPGVKLIGEEVQAIADAIACDVPRWDLVDLHPLDKENLLFDMMLEAFRKSGMAVQPYFCFGNWYLEVSGRSYHEYFETLPSALRNTLQRRTRQLEKQNALQMRIFQHPCEVEEAILAYETAYKSSWKSPEPYPDFLPSLIRLCAEKEWLRLGVAYIDNQVAAAQLWIVYDEVASIYKLAYDKRFMKTSVGSILTARLMQHVIDVDKVTEVDFLSGDEVYKRDWMSHRRERWGIAAFNLRTVRGVMAACRNLGGAALKNMLTKRR